jgi:F0F1-type ATP synthase delta subunit
VLSKINVNIGGGIIFQIDDLRYDASVRGQLERVRKGLASKK